MQVKLFFVTFNVNCGFYAASVGKTSERMSHFWMVPLF